MEQMESAVVQLKKCISSEDTITPTLPSVSASTCRKMPATTHIPKIHQSISSQPLSQSNQFKQSELPSCTLHVQIPMTAVGDDDSVGRRRWGSIRGGEVHELRHVADIVAGIVSVAMPVVAAGRVVVATGGFAVVSVGGGWGSTWLRVGVGASSM